jgi:hypothetical protein
MVETYYVVFSEVRMLQPVWAWTASKQTALTGQIGCSPITRCFRKQTSALRLNSGRKLHTALRRNKLHCKYSFAMWWYSPRLFTMKYKAGRLQRETEHAAALRLQMLQIRSLRDDQILPLKISIIFVDQPCNIRKIYDWARLYDTYQLFVINNHAWTRWPGFIYPKWHISSDSI